MVVVALGLLAGIAGLVCGIIILVEAFRDAVWKGFVGLLCGLYLLYYALFEFEHDQKWLLVLGWLGGGSVMGGLLSLAPQFLS